MELFAKLGGAPKKDSQQHLVDFLAALVNVVATAVLVITVALLAGAAGWCASRLAQACGFGVFAEWFAVVCAVAATAVAFVPPRRKTQLAAQDAQRIHLAAIESDLTRSEKAVIGDVQRRLSRTSVDTAKGVSAVFDGCCARTNQCFGCTEFVSTRWAASVQVLLVLSALAQLIDMWLVPPDKPMQAVVTSTVCLVQLVDVLVTLTPRLESCGMARLARAINTANSAFCDALHATAQRTDAVVGTATDAVVRTAMRCVPASSTAGGGALDMNAFQDALKRQLQGGAGGARTVCGVVVPAWISAPFKYARALLAISGTTVRHSPLKCAAVLASLVLAIDGLHLMMRNSYAAAKQAARLAARHAANAVGIAAAPPPPVWAAFSFLTTPFRGAPLAETPAGWVEGARPMLALVAALATAAATTDAVRQVLRPQEVADERRLERLWLDSIDAARERTAAMVGSVISGHLSVVRAVEQTAKATGAAIETMVASTAGAVNKARNSK